MNKRRFISRSLPLIALALLPLSACDQTSSPATNDLQASPNDLTVPSRFGLIRVTGTTSGSSAVATFLDTQQADASCQHRALGACVLYTCAGTTFAQPNAGSLAITGGSQAVTLPVRNDGSYIAYGSSSMVTFAASQKLTLDAPGGVVPPLHTDLTPPNNPFSLSNPDGSRSTIVFNLNRQRDFHVTWTALTFGSRVHAELNQDLDSNRGMILDCDFDGSTGDGVIPTGLLSGFQLTDSGTLAHGASLIVGPSTNLNLKPGNWDIAVYGMANGRDAFANITDN